MMKKITIGWTKSDMANGYSSFDGYKPGASQHVETIEVDVPTTEDSGVLTDMTPAQIADYVFQATNDPSIEYYPSTDLAPQIHRAIAETGYRGKEAHYSLSIGDTVTVDGVTVACERGVGWKVVESQGVSA